MNYYGKLFFMLILSALFAGGCLSLKQPTGKINYYSLEYDPPVQNLEICLPFVIRVERFQASPLYDTAKIVFREEKFKRDTYIYHKWWAKPGDMVSYFLARDMKASRGFKAVFAFDKSLPSSHVLEGGVDEFFEQDGPDSWEAVLSVEVTLLAENEPDISRRILLQKKYSARELCSEKNPRALAEAMSRAMSKISEKIITEVYGRLARDW